MQIILFKEFRIVKDYYCSYSSKIFKLEINFQKPINKNLGHSPTAAILPSGRFASWIQRPRQYAASTVSSAVSDPSA